MTAEQITQATEWQLRCRLVAIDRTLRAGRECLEVECRLEQEREDIWAEIVRRPPDLEHHPAGWSR